MNDSNQIKFGAIISYGVVIFNVIAGLLYTPWMVAKIGKNDYGLYILATTFLAYFVVDYGMWQSISKLVSQYRAEGSQKKIENVIGIATKIYLVLDIIVCVALFTAYFFIDSIFKNLTPYDLVKFKTVFVIAAIFSILNFPFGFVRGIIYAYEYLIESRFFELGTKVVIIICTVAALLFGGGLYWLVLVYASVPLIKNAGIIFFLYKKGIRMSLKFWSRAMAKSIIGISVWLFLCVLAELFINNISPAIITIKSHLEQVAIFGIGITIYGYAFSISNSVSGFFLPKVTRMIYIGQQKEIYDYAIKIGRLQLIISGFIIFGIIVSGSLFINAWMGKSFANSYYVAVLMLLPGLIIYTQQIELTLLYAENKIYFQSIMMLFTAITTIILSLVFTPKFGAIGAAIAICIANMGFMVIGMNMVYRKVLKFNSRRFFRMAFKFVSVFLLIGGCVKLFEIFVYEPYLLLSNKWADFVIMATFYTVLYAILVYFLLLNNYEKELVKHSVRKAKKILMNHVQR